MSAEYDKLLDSLSASDSKEYIKVEEQKKHENQLVDDMRKRQEVLRGFKVFERRELIERAVRKNINDNIRRMIRMGVNPLLYYEMAIVDSCL